MIVAPGPAEPVAEPNPAFDLLSLATCLLASIRKLIDKKEANASRCTALERQLAEEREVLAL